MYLNIRHKNGRFTKTENERIYIDLRFIKIKRVIGWIMLLTILLQWLAIISKFNLVQKILDFIQSLMEYQKKDDSETSTKKRNLLLNSIKFLFN